MTAKSQTDSHYDCIVVGAGQAGSPLSEALAKAHHKTALIEAEHVGGTCVNVGCTPTKTMVASARVAYLARRGADYGVHTGEISIDMTKIRERKRAIVNSFRSGSESGIAKTDGLELIRGEARFTSPKTLEVHLTDGGTRQISADQIFLNVGARPSAPHIDGLDMISTLNSTSIMELDQVPEHLMIIGGGYIGLEFGQMFRRFGSKVTIIQRGARLLAREDADVADEVAKILREDGIDVLLETDTVRAASANDGVQLTVKDAQGERTLSGSHVLVAAGRTSNADRLNLAAAGVQTDKAGFITVNDKLETNVPDIYCLGDAKGGPAFTHISYDDFRIVRTNFIEGGSASIHNRIVPYTVFIDPQLGRVGLGEEEARAQGLNIRVAKLPMTSVARAEETAETRGFMKAVLDAQSGQILGCAILGIDGGEVMAVIQVAMMGKLPYTVLRDTAFAHPTVAESLNNLFMTLDS